MKPVDKLFEKIEERYPVKGAGWAHRWNMLKLKLNEILSKPIHVICCNDSVEAVVIGSEKKAKKKCEQMKAAHIEKQHYHLRGKELEDQKRVLYYHLHTVNVFFIN